MSKSSLFRYNILFDFVQNPLKVTFPENIDQQRIYYNHRDLLPGEAFQEKERYH